MMLKRDVAYFVLNLLGIAVCFYSLHVENSKAIDKDYVAMCDLSFKASCSKAVTSDYSRGFGIAGPLLGEDSLLNVSNAAYGILLYVTLIAIGFVPALTWASVVMVMLGIPVNMYLAYVMVVILGDVCLLCSTLYTINFTLVGVSLYRWHRQCSTRTVKPHHN